MSEVYEVTLTILIEDMGEVLDLEAMDYQPEVISIKEI